MVPSAWPTVAVGLAVVLAGAAPSLATAASGLAASPRPQLTAAQAASLTPAGYLQNWVPPAVPAATALKPTLTVGPRSAYKTVQSAITAAVKAGGSSRVLIAVTPGTYRESVCVPSEAPPITLYGTGKHPEKTVIVNNRANLTPKPSGTPANPCAPNTAATTYGTTSSATFTSLADDFQAKNVTFSNDYVEGSYAGDNQSAVALNASGDRQVYDTVKVIGNQDTFLSNSRSADLTARQYVAHSLIEGDVDFIFGRGTAVIDQSEIRYTTARRSDGNMFAPATAAANPYGFLIVASRLTATGTANHAVRLGRAWDAGVSSLSAYVNGTSPNGQLVIRESEIGPHVVLNAPWDASTTGRPFCTSNCPHSANRFFEYRITGAGSAGTP